jgi:hypothetical protein
MFKKFIPFAHSQSIYEIEPEFYLRNNVKTLFMDLDNTLDSYRAREPKERTIAYVKALKEKGITPIIISNNKAKRVSGYANKLGIDFLSSAHKPFSRRIKKEISKRGLTPDDVMLVGDQLMTDVLAAKGAKIKVVLTEKIVKEDQWTTHINRIFDRPIRKYHRKRNNLVDWRNK